jgi:hypothetical protein
MKKRIWSVVLFATCVMAAAFLLMSAGLKMTVANASSESALPGMRTLGSISDQFSPVKFDHPKHVMIAGSCASCHHQHLDSKKLNCMDCHAITPTAFKNSVKHNFLACSSCHGAPNPDSPTVPGLKVAYHKTCFKCHRGMGDIGMSPKGCTEICHARKSDKIGMKAQP